MQSKYLAFKDFNSELGSCVNEASDGDIGVDVVGYEVVITGIGLSWS